jgi:hypothetical protein
LPLDAGDMDIGRMAHQPGAGKAHREGIGFRFQGIAGRDQPPDLIQFQRPARHFADIKMAGMGRIETAAQQADAKTVADGAGWPDPRSHQAQTVIKDVSGPCRAPHI